MPGDVAHGRKLFFDNAPGAVGGVRARCHRINGQGTEFGPDLLTSPQNTPRRCCSKMWLNPRKRLRKVLLYLLRTADGQAINGLLVSKSDAEVVLKDVEKQYHIKTADVKKLTPQTTSMMPEGMLQYMSAQEAADLLEHLFFIEINHRSAPFRGRLFRGHGQINQRRNIFVDGYFVKYSISASTAQPFHRAHVTRRISR